MTKFLGPREIWPRITALARKSKRSLVAVAYFGQNARKLLPLKAGSVLVADCHAKSVRGGRTCPHDLLKLIRKGVEIHSCSNLHAKVFVFGNRAIIGSSNASSLSMNFLLEAAVETTDRKTVAACKEFILSIRGDQISPKFAIALSKIWNPPKIFGVPRSLENSPIFHALWTVPLVRSDWDEIDDRNDRLAEPKAKKKIMNRKRFQLEKFHWAGVNPLLTFAKTGHQIVQVIDEGNATRVYPPARVIHTKRYLKAGEKQSIIYLESPRVKPARRRLKTVRESLKELGPKLIVKHAARRIKDPLLAHALLQLWPGRAV